MSSKLSKLKQDAYQAGKKRNWAEAMAIYERILELDKNNPALLNELGDICLKNADPERAVRHFLNAASKYRQTGLLNNAVAVYKKVLRHDPDNVNAHWFLAEIRASQGLVVDGEAHADRFLAAADEVSGEFKEIFLKRCLQLIGLYPGSRGLLERVQGIFRVWNQPIEQARTCCVLACERLAAGDPQAAREYAEAAVVACPEVVNYGEYARWIEVVGEVLEPADGRPAPASPAATPPAAAAPEPAAVVPEPPAWGDLRPQVEPPAGDEDDDGCLRIDDTGESSFADLIAAAEASVDAAPRAQEQPSGSVDLLQELLAESGDDFAGGAERQIDTISAEIGARVGGEAACDPQALYQQGLVYLELGMHGLAAEAFERAAGGDGWALRACEMWGIALLRDARDEAALEAFARGLATADAQPRETIGLLYHAGLACERLGRTDDALAWFERCHAIDPAFLDVARRVSSPVV